MKLSKPLEYYSMDNPMQPASKYGNFSVHYGGPCNYSRYYKSPFRPNDSDPGYFYGCYKGVSGSELMRMDVADCYRV